MTSDAFNSMLAELSAEYRRGLPEKFAEIDRLCSAWSPDDLVKLQRELHTLVGTGKTMGLPAVTDAARAAETFLEPYFAEQKAPPAGELAKFNQLLDALKQAA
jgi:chemotaxis protein histidine kinase CheA